MLFEIDIYTARAKTRGFLCRGTSCRAGFLVAAALCLVSAILQAVALSRNDWYIFNSGSSGYFVSAETEYGLFGMTTCMQSASTYSCYTMSYTEAIETSTEFGSDYYQLYVAGILTTFFSVINILFCVPVVVLLVCRAFKEWSSSQYPRVFTERFLNVIPYTPLCQVFGVVTAMFSWAVSFPYLDFIGPLHMQPMPIGSGIILMIVSFCIAVAACVVSTVMKKQGGSRSRPFQLLLTNANGDVLSQYQNIDEVALR